MSEGSKADIKDRAMQQRRVIGLEPGQDIPRVLVAEDTETSRLLLVEILEAVGLDVQAAVNGKEAVEIFNKWQPHFIWMDARMPVMGGLEATRRIKETEAGRSTPVAALTAHALEEEKEKILAAGCDDFVRKPFHLQEIFEVMAKHLGLKYVYGDEQEEAEPVQTNVVLHPEQLATMPQDLLGRLHQAVVELDRPRIQARIEQIAEQDASIGNAFKALAKKLDYGRLLRLLEEGGDR